MRPPQDGFIDLPDRPGFGVTLTHEKLKRPYPRDGQSRSRETFLLPELSLQIHSFFVLSLYSQSCQGQRGPQHQPAGAEEGSHAVLSGLLPLGHVCYIGRPF